MVEAGWFQYLDGVQGVAVLPEMWISCIPSSILEPETLKAVQADTVLTKGGKKKYIEMGWFPVAPKADWGDGVKDFLDKHEEKSVVYVRWV